MSVVRGRVSIDVQFRDSTASASVQSLKTISLQESTEYATGKVAVVTGTVSPVSQTIAIPPVSYRDAAGNVSTLTQVTRIAFAATGSVPVRCLNDDGSISVLSRNGQVGITEMLNPAELFVQLQGISTAQTASYTLVLYGT